MGWAVSELPTARLGRCLGAVTLREPGQCFLCSHSQAGNETLASLEVHPQFGTATIARLGMKPCPGWE